MPWLFVATETKQSEIEDFFRKCTSRKDLAILLINQHIANSIRHLVTAHVEHGTAPTILEIPSKEFPYSKEQDPIMQTVLHLLGAD